MESNQELQHWGIKGMRWGIRRYQNEDGTLTEAGKKHYKYQNPDGTLTEEGKKNYMTGAKKGKIDPKKLSDADLNMINSRFARERTFNENIQKYKESTFSYKLQKAVIDRIKGNGGGGGKGNGGGGGKGKKFMANLLLTPIQNALEDAFKSGSGKGNGDSDGDKEEKVERFIFSGGKGNKTISDFIAGQNDHIATGKNYMGVDNSRPVQNKSTGNWNTNRNTTAEDVIRSRHGYTTNRVKNDWKVTSNKRKKKMKHSDFEEEFLTHRDTLVPFVIVRSDELMHYGINGQKWGVRRFENSDGTLTPEGKERYSKENSNLSYDYKNERRKIAQNRPNGFSEEENKVISRIQNGETVDNEVIQKISRDHFMRQHELSAKYEMASSESEKTALRKEIEHEQVLMDFAYDKIPALNRENKYEKEIASETDPKYIDPSYRKFSNKEEKAAAEAEYLQNTWHSGDPQNGDTVKWGRECQHISDRVWGMSYDGYDGKPQSDRVRSMFDYDPHGDGNNERWKPKYENTEEWKKIQSDRKALKDRTGYTSAESAFFDALKSGAFKNKSIFDKYNRALTAAHKRFNKRLSASDIEKREQKIMEPFYNKVTECVLKDLGYEVNDTNMRLIQSVIWYN